MASGYLRAQDTTKSIGCKMTPIQHISRLPPIAPSDLNGITALVVRTSSYWLNHTTYFDFENKQANLIKRL